MISRKLRIVLLSALSALPMTAAIACPNPDLAATAQVRANGAALRLGQNRRASGGGTQTLDDCPNVTLPSVPAMAFNDAPSLTADLSGMLGLAMEIRADGFCATGLLVRTADGKWYFDDKSRGQGMPRIMLRAPGSGPMRVWVGTPDGSVCRTRINLMTYPGFR